MAFFDTVKGWFKKEPATPKKKKSTLDSGRITVYSMEEKYEMDDLVGAAKDLKMLLEDYGRKKRKNHRYKGREFIHFILSNKHKDLKKAGYQHWQNINQIITANYDKVYPYHKVNLRKAMDFFRKEIKNINSLDLEA
ncbi:MAG: hypothetical protein JXB08_03250 [Bacilli bacterium]|nr:hypothetical protein [Bacilli bacterium]MBN2876306.1 hypothetical protein [Bacilli bacterium]